PLVRRAHDAAQGLAREGRRVVVVGKRDHVEVRGIVEDLDSPRVVADAAEVERWPDRALGVVCQTTTPEATAAAVLAAIRDLNPDADVRAIDTICSPTKARIQALRELVARVDVLVAVGGKGSNNTQRLVEAALAAGVRAHHVERAEELCPEWFAADDTVGLTAGTSTLDRTIAAVRDRLHRFAAAASR
ncbi:MAG: 4-hydroxy-3-methylbut-2-enyl diphosphate reductase, partial [Planctomycetes bacterium]|nr:4-hydroxy-3-methylbut-2-enyl diphosphate reductase [Planctomycetota bacterium]